jgi:leucyl-tRNA synthetase
MMEWYNFLGERVKGKGESLTLEEAEVFLKLLAPFAPHMTEELYQTVILDLIGDPDSSINPLDSRVRGNDKPNSIHFSAWPTYDEKYLVQDEIVIPIQVNGKRRGEIKVKSDKGEGKSDVEALAKEVIKTYIEGKEVKKVIYVPGKIINFVV